MPVDPNQSLAGVDVDTGRGELFIQCGKRASRKFLILESLVHRPMQGVVTVVIHRLTVCPQRQQRLYQRNITGSGGGHQWRLVHWQAMLDAVLIALLKDVFEVAGKIRHIGLALQRWALLRKTACLLVFCFLQQPPGQLRLIKTGGIFKQLLLQFAARHLFAEHLDQQLPDSGFFQHRPRHRRLLEDAAADGLGLLLLALQLQFARFFLPVFQRCLSGFNLDLAQVEIQQPEQGVRGIRLDHVDILDGARQRHIQRVDVELVDFQRLVAFVFGAPVVQRFHRQIGLVHAVNDVAEFSAMIGDEAIKDDILVFEALGFVDGEQQRRSEVFARLGLVFVTHHQHRKIHRLADFLVELTFAGVLVRHQRHLSGLAADSLHQKIALAVDGAKAPLLDFQQLIGHPRGFQPIAEIRCQHAQRLPLGQRRVLPEQAFDLAPGEKVGMYDLVGIAAQQKMAGLFQSFEHQRQLHGGDVLHFVDHHKIVTRRRQRLPFLRDQIQIVELGLDQPGAIFLEQLVERIALPDRKNRLAHTQRTVVFA